MSNNLPNQAQISGTLGGLFAERIMVAFIPMDFAKQIAVTMITTTISFALPYLYKWLIKKYQSRNGIRNQKYMEASSLHRHWPIGASSYLRARSYEAGNAGTGVAYSTTDHSFFALWQKGEGTGSRVKEPII